jgi:uncharacterized damage-inducible protein DinB
MSEQDVLLGPPPAALEHLLSDDGMEFTPFSRALRDITWQVADSKQPGAHSVAEILGHMRFWQQRVLDMAAGEAPAAVPNAQVGWPAVSREEWPGLVESYLEEVEALRRIAREGWRLDEPVRHGQRKTLGYLIMSHLAHEAHHLGQIILLRRQQGAWPPPGGGDSW